MKSRLMYIERKYGLRGPARIGWVRFSQTGKTIYYSGRAFQSVKGRGTKFNYYDIESGETYWIADERPYALTEIIETVCRALQDELGVTCAARQLHLPAAVGDVARLLDGALQALGRYNQQIHVLGEMAHSIACSIGKAKRELGYAPTVGLYEGMRASIRWCVANGMPI